MAIIGKLFWLALFLAFTFSFLVLFEYGPSNFRDNAPKEWVTLKQLITRQTTIVEHRPPPAAH